MKCTNRSKAQAAERVEGIFNRYDTYTVTMLIWLHIRADLTAH
jgi:hypothetical protein